MRYVHALPIGSLVLFATLAAQSVAAQTGAPSGADVNDKEVIKAAQFAVKAQQQAMKDAGKTEKLALLKIVRAQKQVVAGMNFIFTLRVKHGDKARTAEATVWWQAWRKEPYKLTAWKFTDEKEEK